LIVDSLDYTDDLIPHYQSLSALPGFVLLESGDKQRGRYDILAAYPYDTFKVLRNTSLPLNDVFDELQSRLSMIACKGYSELPFQGGAIGYIAYDFGEMLAGLPSRPHHCNDMPLIDMQFYDWAIVVDHHLKCIHLLSVNSKDETAAIVLEIRARWEAKTTRKNVFKLNETFMPLLHKDDYREAFDSIYAILKAGRAYQVNYTQPFLAHHSGDTWELYKRIRLKNPVPYAAYMRRQEGHILSFSPERFISMEKGRVVTSPIKGTVKRSANVKIDNQLQTLLKTSSKNRAENVMIVDLLRNDLSKISKPGSVQVTSLCEVQSFKAVHHLVSHIEAQSLDTVTALNAFLACFPGGSITGAPKREAMHVINEHEPFARGVYCGSIAYFSAHGRVDSNIAIRTITAKEETLYLSAGGGIVIDSQWEDEYSECFTKLTAIVNALS